jgi:hypothetical protein
MYATWLVVLPSLVKFSLNPTKQFKAMKNIVKFVATAAFAAWITAPVLAKPLFEPKIECANNSCAGFRIGMYRVKGTLTMKLMLEKEKGVKVTVVLKDKNGKVLHRDNFGKSVTKTGRKFNFSEVEDGTYTLEIADEHEKIEKQIRLNTKEIKEVSGRTLVAMN